MLWNRLAAALIGALSSVGYGLGGMTFPQSEPRRRRMHFFRKSAPPAAPNTAAKGRPYVPVQRRKSPHNR